MNFDCLPSNILECWLESLPNHAINRVIDLNEISPGFIHAHKSVLEKQPLVSFGTYNLTIPCDSFLKELEPASDLLNNLSISIPDTIIENPEQLAKVGKIVGKMRRLKEVNFKHSNLHLASEESLISFVNNLSLSLSVTKIDVSFCNLLSFNIKTLEAIGNLLLKMNSGRHCRLFNNVNNDQNISEEKKYWYAKYYLFNKYISKT